MNHLPLGINPVDYLIIGHVTQDLSPNGVRLGGTVSYGALTARALGLTVGIVTSCAEDMDLSPLEGISIIVQPSEYSTTFENRYTAQGRVQILHSQAEKIDATMIPDCWKNAPIVHLAPVAQEVDPNITRLFPDSFIGMTIQGWLREWKNHGRVQPCEWPEANYVLEKANAVVLSEEDVQGDDHRVEEMASSIRLMAITEGAAGSRIYWNGDLRHFSAPFVDEIDATGAGDIFASVFFAHTYHSHDPWDAIRIATQLASISVTREGLAGIPTAQEIRLQQCVIV